jgi:hypothetical protein
MRLHLPSDFVSWQFVYSIFLNFLHFGWKMGKGSNVRPSNLVIFLERKFNSDGYTILTIGQWELLNK